MCAVCWTGSQVIPVTAVAARYVWVNHFQMQRLSRSARVVDESEDEVAVADFLDEAERDELQLEGFDHELLDEEPAVEELVGV